VCVQCIICTRVLETFSFQYKFGARKFTTRPVVVFRIPGPRGIDRCSGGVVAISFGSATYIIYNNAYTSAHTEIYIYECVCVCSRALISLTSNICAGNLNSYKNELLSWTRWQYHRKYKELKIFSNLRTINTDTS